jgi:transketolase
MAKLTREQLTAARNTLMAMHARANVGHLGGNLSALDATMLLHHEFLGPDDRFILSKGHAVGALYVTLASLGQLPPESLATFHGNGTSLPGHPPAQGTPQIPFATGSLGHGLSLAAGLALAERFGTPKRHVWCLTSDGEWQEGSTWEALIFACHHRLANLTILVDFNSLQGFGRLSEVASMEDLDRRIAAHGANVRHCDGHDLEAMRRLLATATGESGLDVVMLHTQKGHGWRRLTDTVDCHYLPPTAEDVAAFQSLAGDRAAAADA